MAKANRHLRGETNEIQVPIHGNVVIEKGDLTYLFGVAAQIHGGYYAAAVDYYGFPAASLMAVTNPYTERFFAGVAMKGSKSGVTETLPVATSGIFRFPNALAQTIKVGYAVSGASSSGTTGYNQSVVCSNAQTANRVGMCVKAGTSQTNVDFALMTIFSGTTPGNWRVTA